MSSLAWARLSGWSTIWFTTAPACSIFLIAITVGCVGLTSLSRYAPISNKWCVSPSHKIFPINLIDAKSAHCKSSKNTTRGCSAVAKARINCWKTRLKRFWFAAASSWGIDGWEPIMCSTSGIISISACPLFSNAAKSACFHRSISSSVSVNNCSISVWHAWIKAA